MKPKMALLRSNSLRAQAACLSYLEVREIGYDNQQVMEECLSLLKLVELVELPNQAQHLHLRWTASVINASRSFFEVRAWSFYESNCQRSRSI